MEKRGRGRPPLKRSPEEKILGNGMTVGQHNWIHGGWKKRGFESAAHFLRYIVKSYIERVEAGLEEDRFTPAGVQQIEREQRRRK